MQAREGLTDPTGDVNLDVDMTVIKMVVVAWASRALPLLLLAPSTCFPLASRLFT